MIEEAIKKVLKRADLSANEAEDVFSEIAQGRVAEKEIESFLVALSHKKETAEEIAGAARAMRRFVTRIRVSKEVVLDTCGTGGDKKGTFNVSTVSAFVAAGAGVTVAKHGNRSVSGCCGSADVLEALGVNINVGVPLIEKCLEELGIGFLYAPALHPAMRFVQPVRRSLKMRTIFNILGPLINPAFPTHQLLGIYDKDLVPVIGQVLVQLEIRHAMVVWGEGGFDEVTTTGETFVCEVKDGHLKEYVIDPEKMGFKKAALKDLLGEDVDTNKQIALNVLKGMGGPVRDIVLLNAGCCLYLAGSANTIKEGIDLAASSIDSGSAIKKLQKLIEYTNENLKGDSKLQEEIS
jgi:anthranilate phosphoribosyltransferase